MKRVQQQNTYLDMSRKSEDSINLLCCDMTEMNLATIFSFFLHTRELMFTYRPRDSDL